MHISESLKMVTRITASFHISRSLACFCAPQYRDWWQMDMTASSRLYHLACIMCVVWNLQIPVSCVNFATYFFIYSCLEYVLSSPWSSRPAVWASSLSKRMRLSFLNDYRSEELQREREPSTPPATSHNLMLCHFQSGVLIMYRCWSDLSC
jgi:hypothetical protein